MTTVGAHAAPCAVADPGSVEARFGARNCRPGGCEFAPAPWVLDEHNRIPAGALMVLADHILGELSFRARPAGWWTLSTEVTLDIIGDLPTRGELTGEARLVRHERHAAFSECAITDAAGKVQAVGSARTITMAPNAQLDGTDVVWHPIDAQSGALDDVLGLQYSATGDSVQVTMPDTTGWVNDFGVLHGGLWACLSDRAATTLIAQRSPALTTARIHTAFLRSGIPGAPVSVTARAHHVGKNFAVVEMSGYSAGTQLCAVTTLTARRVGPEI